MGSLIVEINGHPTWVEDRGGDGDAVLVLHGGLSDSGGMAGIGEALAGSGRRVVAFDRRGHGRTADTDAPFHYEDMATEAIAVLEQVVGGPAALVGWSDGGIVSLLVARRRPDLVRAMVLIGTNYHHDGLHPDAFADAEGSLDMIREGYVAVSPDGAEHWPVVLEKTMAMFLTEPTLTPSDLADLATPALVLVGDDDLLTLEHTCSLYESLPNSRLAVIPGASHVVVMERPDLVHQFVLEFLSSADAAPATFMPLRRR
jgi:pimeloyl-ACP methyl ester carboxylesterase